MRAPLAVTQAPMRTVRTRDIGGRNPAQRAMRLVEDGALIRLAHGYLMATPDDQAIGWKPTIEAAAAGIAAAIFGQRNVVLMGVTAARVHHAIPRALGIAVIAAPEQHRPVQLATGGQILFVKRNTTQLDARLTRLEIGQALVTTPEQTLIDLAKRPTLGGLPQEAAQAVAILLQTADLDAIMELAGQQRATRAIERLLDELHPAAA